MANFLIEKSCQDSITPPQRGAIALNDLRKSFSDSKRKRFERGLYINDDDELMIMKRANEGLNNSFSHFKSYKELIEMNPNIYMKANKHCKFEEEI